MLSLMLRWSVGLVVMFVVGGIGCPPANVWAQVKKDGEGGPPPRVIDLTNRALIVLGEGRHKIVHELDKGVAIKGAHKFQTEIVDSKIDTKKFLELRDITFKDCAITMEDNQYCAFVDCRFINTKVTMLGTWDCLIEDCSFIQNKGECLHVEGSQQRQTNCLTVSRCRFEGNQNDVNVFVGQRSRKLFFQNCKSHGPETKTHMRVEKSDALRIVDCNITQKGTGIDAEQCNDLFIADNMLDNLGVAVRLKKCTTVVDIESRNIFPRDQRNGVNVLVE